MKKLFFIPVCLLFVCYYFSADAVPAINRAGSVRVLSNAPQQILPQKSTTNVIKPVTTITNSISNKNNTGAKITNLSNENSLARFGVSKKIKNLYNPKQNTTSETPAVVPSSDVVALQNQIESLQKQLAAVQSELSHKAENETVVQLNDNITNKIENLDTKFVKNEELDTKFDNLDNKFIKPSQLGSHLTNQGILTSQNLDTELNKKGFLKDSDLSKAIANKGILKDYVTRDTVAADIENVKSETNTKISQLDSKIENVADVQFDETSLKEHFDNFLDNELNKTNDNKFDKFTKNAELDAKITNLKDFKELKNDVNNHTNTISGINNLIDTKIIDKGLVSDSDITADKLVEKLKDRFASKDEIISDAQLDDKIEHLETFKILKNDVNNHTNTISGINNLIEDKLKAKGLLTKDTLDAEFLAGKGILTKTTIDTELQKKGIDKTTLISDIKSAKNEAITDTDEKIAEVNARISSITNTQIDEQALREHFDDYLDNEINKTNNSKFDRFTKNSELNTKIANLENFKNLKNDVVNHTNTISGLGDIINNKINEKSFLTRNDIIADLSDDNSELGKKFKGLDTKFAAKDEISGFTKESELSGKLSDFLDTELGKTTNNKFDRFTKNDDFSGKVNRLLDYEIGKSDGRFAGFTKNAELDNKITNLDTFKAFGTRLGNAETNIAANANKFSKYTDNDGLNAKIATLENFRGLGTRITNAETNITANTNKFADYTKTSGLGSIISGRIKNDIEDSNSDLAKQFGKYTTTSGLNTKLGAYATTSALSSVDGKFSDYTKTSGLGSVISSRIGTELGNSDSALSKKFGNYATTSAVATAKSEAISAAATDATTKATNAKNDAISAAASSVDTKLSDYSTTAQIAKTLSGDNSITTLSGLKSKLATSASFESLQAIVTALDGDISDISDRVVFKETSVPYQRIRRVPAL